MTSYPIEIPIRSGTFLRILSETSIEVHDFACIFGSYYIPDTRDLDSIKAVLANPDWDEMDLNAAISSLNDEWEAYCNLHGERVAGALN